jgi:hypothetical protein
MFSARLNWEIEKSSFDKEDKDYSINVSYDYFEIGKNKKGSQKSNAQLDGSFIVNDAFENVDVRFKDDKALDYSLMQSGVKK